MFEAVAFLGAFLAFSLELIAAKTLLPLFGGSALVWTTAMMFFQGTLLAGYLYGRFVLARFEMRRYAKAHFVLLLLPVLFFPISVSSDPHVAAPTLGILWTLARAIGFPFFLLSTTTLLMQSWLQRRKNFPGGAYFIYAASNAGAFAALIVYPLFMEPLLDTGRQLSFWSALYALYAALHLLCLPPQGSPPAAPPKTDAPTRRQRFLWLTFSAASSAALLAATNYLANNLAAVPLLWIFPLAVYLATFILNFKKNPWKPGRLYPAFVVLIAVFLVPASVAFLPSHAVAAGSLLLLMQLITLIGFSLNAAGLVIVCMLCHKSLAETRPSGEAAMPDFYASLALGGWLGSLLIAVALPLLARNLAFTGLEWLLAAGLALAGLLAREGLPAKRSSRGLAVFALSLALALAAVQVRPAAGTIGSLRNFYGTYRVRETADLRKFFHGNTLHGMQYTDRFLRPFPLGYYHPESPFGRLFEAFGGSLKNIGVVGLGIGSIAAFGRPGQAMDFYELDPDVEFLARKHFRYLQDSKAQVRVVAGDARMSLSRQDGASYELLVLDAFSSDAIPVHLLTREAFALYLKRIKPDGLIACHVSSRFLDLKPILAAAAQAQGLHGAAKASTAKEVVENEIMSQWVVLSPDPSKIKRLTAELGWTDLNRSARPVKAWTDRHASLLPALGF